MMYHHFQVGQFITAHASGVPAGPYRITRLLPVASGVPQYRLKSVVDDHERTVLENAMRVARPASLVEHLADEGSDLGRAGGSRKKLA
jgi:hypothetical protein